jgi:hypothetical protein
MKRGIEILCGIEIAAESLSTIVRVLEIVDVDAGSIGSDFGHAWVPIEGSVDPDCVRAAVEGLSRGGDRQR